MGRRYSFQLFYPADRVEAGLRAMNAHLPAIRPRRKVRAAEPPGSVAPPVLRALTPDSPVFFRMSLLLPADEYVRAFWPPADAPDLEWDDEGNERIPVGDIAVAVRTGARHALIEYAAVTSSMSDLLERSRATWRQFGEMLRASGGLVALFNGVTRRGPAEYPVLPEGREAVTLDFFDFVTEERETYWQIDVDRLAGAVLGALQKE